MAPSTKVAVERPSSPKNAKQRISVLACAYGDGTEKIGLMIIGNDLKHRPFKTKSGQKLHFEYRSNKKLG